MILCQYGAGRRRAERLLTPLRRMAETAQSLDKTFDTRKYHDLEEAISQVNVGVDNARIETGDRDLKGMEEAVNGCFAARRRHIANKHALYPMPRMSCARPSA